MWRFFVAITIVLMGCTRPEAPVQITAPPLAKSSQEATPKVSASAAATTLTTPTTAPQVDALPIIPTATPGPAYVLVDHSGVLQITENGATTVFPVPKENSSHFTEIALSPTGNLWLTDFQGIRIRTQGGDVSSLRSVKDGPLYKKLIVRSDNDAWAVSSDIEWSVLHYEGRNWKTIRRRAQFPGKYDDNKFEALAVTSEGVWVSSWNGLWRGVGEKWEKITLPDGISTGPDLFVYRDELIVASPGAVYLRKEGAWNKSVWPDKNMLWWVISDLGLFAAPSHGKPRVVIGRVDGTQPFIESDPILGQDFRKLAIDGSGRIWVGTDQALAVLDHRGHLLMQWSAGTLDGLTGSIIDIAVTGGGPQKLPAAKAARLWDVKGRFVTYKRSSSLAGATLTLCAPGAANCATDSRAKHTTTDAQGTFRFSATPEGEFWIHVQAPPGTDDCETPFTVMDKSLVPARDCHEVAGAPGVCDLGTIMTCLPFEMPPPPPHHRR